MHQVYSGTLNMNWELQSVAEKYYSSSVALQLFFLLDSIKWWLKKMLFRWQWCDDLTENKYSGLQESV